MKKITLLIVLALSFVFTNEVIAQTLNQNATWPNINWTISGTFTDSAGPEFSFEANPTVDANFAFDDDDAGATSDDSIAAESPVIDLTAAFTASETLLTVNVDYVYRKFSVEEFLRFQYYDADAMIWVNWEPESMPGNDNALTDDFCAGTPLPYTTVELDIAAFTGTQQSGFQYRILFDDDPNGPAYEYGFCLNSPIITSAAPLMCTQAVINGTSIVNDCGNSQFQIDVDVDSVGDGTFINDGTNTFAIVGGSNLVGPYASGTNVTLTIEHSDVACDFPLSDVAFTCPTIPTVDGTLTINGCLDSDSFTTPFDGVVKSIYWLQLDYDGGCFQLTADTAGTDFDTELGLYDLNGILVANNDDDFGGITPQSLFTEMALPAGTYYLAAGEYNMAFGADNFDVTFIGTPNDTGTLVVNASTPSDNTVDFCNLQFPFEGNIQTGDNHDVYTQVYEGGVTEPQGEQGAGIEAWIGFSETDAITTSDFTSGDWTWVLADYNVTGPASNNDEYFAEIGSGRAEGVYYYVSRYSIDGGPFAYGGINPGGSDGNFWDGTLFVSGELTVTNPPPPGNDECADAVVLTVNPDYGCGTVTNGTITSATDSGVDNCGGTEDDDVWYSFVATNTEHRIELLSITGSTADLYHAIYDATPGCGALGAAVLCSDPNVSNPTGLTIGVTYFVQVYSWTATAGQTSVFDICIGTPPTCLPPTALSANNETETTADLGWTENGTATTWNIEWGATGFVPGTGNTEAGVVTNPYTLTGLTTETDYEFYVLADCGGGDLSTWVGPFAFSTLPPPPANDDCTGAISLTPGSVFDSNPVDGTVGGATNDAEANGCGLDGPGVWYTVVVPADGNITIETGPDAATSNGDFDSVIEAFSGDCGSLVSIECDDDDAAGFDGKSLLELTGLASGETIYIRVWEYNGDETEPFSISAYNATLSVDSFDNENAFSYFPNPVKNELTLKAKNTIQNVSVLNMLGQEVLRISPNALESKLDMNTLSQGSYFVQVTINNVTEIVRVIKD